METFKNVKVDNKSVSQTLPRGVICDGLLERLRGTGRGGERVRAREREWTDGLISMATFGTDENRTL